jgi:type VI secretion system protein VasD
MNRFRHRKAAAMMDRHHLRLILGRLILGRLILGRLILGRLVLGRLILGLLALLALTQCGPPPPPPVLNLTIVGSTDQNPNRAGRAEPVAVRIYQLSDIARFAKADIFSLKDDEAKTLGSDDVTSSLEFPVAPGETMASKIDLKPMVSWIGVAVMYRDIDVAKWRALTPANASGPTSLTVNIGRLAVTLKSGS